MNPPQLLCLAARTQDDCRQASFAHRLRSTNHAQPLMMRVLKIRMVLRVGTECVLFLMPRVICDIDVRVPSVTIIAPMTTANATGTMMPVKLGIVTTAVTSPSMMARTIGV